MRKAPFKNRLNVNTLKGKMTLRGIINVIPDRMESLIWDPGNIYEQN